MKNKYKTGRLFALLVLIFVEFEGFCQTGTVFQKMYREKRTDDCRDFQSLTDGYLLSGLSTSFNSAGDSDMYIVKVDLAGEKVWHKQIGGTGQELGNSICKTSDGNFVIAGFTSSKGNGSYDAYVVKIDGAGNIIWDKTFGGSGSDQARQASPTSDGGVIVGGYTTSSGAGNKDMWLFKLDASGNQQWSKTFGGSAEDYAYSVQQTSDGGYILLGSTFSFGSAGDFYLIKTDASGNNTWNQYFGGSGNEEGQYVIQDADGGFVMVGDQLSNSAGDYDVSVRKFDASGTAVWSKLYGGAGKDVVKMIQKTNDGGFIVAAISRDAAPGANPDMWTIKLDGSGNKQWDKLLGGKDHEHCYAAKQTPDGGYLVAGHTDSAPSIGIDVFLVKTDASGATAPSITSVSGINDIVQQNVLQLYPNPVIDQLHIGASDLLNGNFKINISNLLGEIVSTKEVFLNGKEEITIETNNLNAGIYFLMIQNRKENLFAQKIIVQ